MLSLKFSASFTRFSMVRLSLSSRQRRWFVCRRAVGRVAPCVTAVRPELWDDKLTPALQRVPRSQERCHKTILSALIALSVIAGVASQANALDAKTFFEQVDRDHC
jgi:hypothetical protein